MTITELSSWIKGIEPGLIEERHLTPPVDGDLKPVHYVKFPINRSTGCLVDAVNGKYYIGLSVWLDKDEFMKVYKDCMGEEEE